MTIEELKALAYADDGGYRSGVAEDLFLTLAPEILALVEACNEMETTWKASAFIARSKALAAFNAKLASL